jgi:ABC-type sugar transport system permease subunit
MTHGSEAGRRSVGAPPRPSWSLLARLVGVALLDIALGLFAHALLEDGVKLPAGFAIAAGVLTTVIFLSPRLYPLRWIAPGLVLLLLFVIYPVVNTVHTSFTNAGGGHLLTKKQALDQLTDETYAPAGASSYRWTAYRAADGTFLLYLRHGSDRLLAAGAGADAELPEAAPPSAPARIDGYRRLTQIGAVRYLSELHDAGFETTAGDPIAIVSLDEAARQEQRYVYSAQEDTLTDRETGAVYRAQHGTFVSDAGIALSPGFAAGNGLHNFRSILSDRNVRDPFLGVFAWTFLFAALSTITCFALGFLTALVLNNPRLPFRSAFRATVLVPYALPIFIGASIWVGLLNPVYGPVNSLLDWVFGVSPSWFTDASLAKVALVLVGLWLGFPYMMLVTLGALQGIPRDVYDAASIDGAGAWASFRYVTLPLVLASVSPILVGAFAFAFNNFTLIELVTKGGPANVSTNTPAGHTDILISYTYRLAFTGGEGINYGLAAAVTILIFAIVAVISIVNFRLTRRFRAIYDFA